MSNIAEQHLTTTLIESQNRHEHSIEELETIIELQGRSIVYLKQERQKARKNELTLFILVHVSLILSILSLIKV